MRTAAKLQQRCKFVGFVIGYETDITQPRYHAPVSPQGKSLTCGYFGLTIGHDMFPVSPSDYKNTVPSTTGTVCSKLLNALIAGPALLYKIIFWAVNSDLSASDALKSWLGLASGSLLQAPTNLVTTNGATTISLAWNQVAAAQSFDVYRSTTPLAPTVGTTVPFVAGLSTNSYVDTSPSVGVSYYYFVVARNASAVSGLSNMATGLAGTGSSTQTFSYGGPNQQTITVPVGKTSAAITAFGGGAGGGGAYNQGPVGQPGNQRAGGGGGSGSKETKTLAVVAGHTIAVYVGNGGLGGVLSNPQPPNGANPTGGAGEQSYVNYDGSLVCSANGGVGGNGAVQGQNGTGGAAGSGGTGDVNTPGNPGSDGSGTLGYDANGGAGGGAVAGSTNAGGKGGSFAGGASGSPGYVTITFT